MKNSTKNKSASGPHDTESQHETEATSIHNNDPSSGTEQIGTVDVGKAEPAAHSADAVDETKPSSSKHAANTMEDAEEHQGHKSQEDWRQSIPDRRRRHSVNGSDVDDTPTKSGRAVGFITDPQFVGATTELRYSDDDRLWVPVALRTNKGKSRARSNSVPPAPNNAFRGTGAATETKTPMRGTGANRFITTPSETIIPSTPTFTDLANVQSGDSDSGSSSSSSSSSSDSDDSEKEEWKTTPKMNLQAHQNVIQVFAPFSLIPNTKQGKRGVKSLAKMSEKDWYSGKDKDPEALARWVRKILMSMLTAGVHADCFAVVSYISQCLSGDADTWFSKHIIDQIQHVYPSDKAWSIASPFPFRKIVKSLKERFVSTTFNHDAQYKWSRLSQTDSKGNVIMTISALALKIEEVAEQKYLTSEYEMKVRFTEAMILEIANIVLDKCEIESKRLTWAKIVRVAIKGERSHNQKVATDFARRSGMRVSNCEVATNRGAFQRLMKKQQQDKDSSGEKSTGKSDRSTRKRDDRSPNNYNKPEASGSGVARSPASGSNRTPTGTPSKYSPKQKAMYNDRKEKGECYVCGSPAHLASHHEGGTLGYMADNTRELDDNEAEFLAFLQLSPEERRARLESETGEELSQFDLLDSDCTEGEFEYESDFNNFPEISNNKREGEHIFEFSPECTGSGPRIREVSGFTDSEYESDDPTTHELRTALITSQLEAVKIQQSEPIEPLISSVGTEIYEPSHAWEEKREAQAAWSEDNRHTETREPSVRHAALNYMQTINPDYAKSDDKTAVFHPISDNLPEIANGDAIGRLSDMDCDTSDESEKADDDFFEGAKAFKSSHDLPYHPGGTHGGFCLLKAGRDRDDYWGWALARNTIEHDLPWLVKDHKGLYHVSFNEQGDCSDEDHTLIASHECSKHCLFNSQWALVAGIPLQGMDILSPNDAFRHRISLSHTDSTSSFEADTDRFAAMGHQIKLGIDDLSDRLPITPDLVFDIKLHGKEGFKAFIDTGSDNSLVAPYLARTLKAHIRQHLTPKILRLGTKGSHAMINSYCFLEMELAGIKKLQRFDVANVFTDCVIGRDVLRTHACAIEFCPDRLIARDIAGTTPPKKGNGGRSPEIASFNYMQSDESAGSSTQRQVSERPHYQKAYDADTPIWDPRHLEKDAERPKFTSKMALKRDGSAGDADSDEYKPNEDEIHEFHDWCALEFKSAFIADGDTLPLPPLRPVQHEIPYIDESDPPRPRRNYKIPDKFMEKWNELHEKHIAAGIWIPMQTRNADPIMPVIKKDGKLRPTVDLRARNANTIKMSCPPLETDFCRNTLAAHKLHVELDVKGCFQQLRTRPADVWKTVFSNATWKWTTAQQMAFEEIKRIVDEDRRLTVIVDNELAPASSSPVHMKEPPRAGQEIANDAEGNYIFLQCDASASGTSATLTLGKNWWSAKTVLTHSRKLTGAQHNYRTHEQELLAVFEGFQKFEGQLLGRKVIVITDNVSLEAFLTGRNFTPRQARVYDYLSQFDFVVKHIAGVNNFVPDMLSRQFEDWVGNPVNQDDSLRDLDTFAALREVRRPSASIANATHGYDSEKDLNVNSRPKRVSKPAVQFEIPVVQKRTARAPTRANERPDQNTKTAALRVDEAWDFPDNPVVLSLDEDYESEFKSSIKHGYAYNKFFTKIVSNLEDFVRFALDEQGMLWQDDNVHGLRMCIPNSLIRERSICEILLEHLHEITGHTSSDKLVSYAQHQFWWPSVAADASKYCKSCPSCQASKKSTTLPSGKLHSMPVPGGPLQDLALDFQGPFPMARWMGQEVDFVVNFIDMFSGELISVPCNQKISAEGVAEIYFTFVFPHWGAPQGLVSDRDVRFNSAFWRALFEGLGTTLFMSSAYHPQTNGKIERMHRDYNQIMRQWVNEDQLNWPQQVPFVQFAINSMKSSSSGFSPFELARTRLPLTIPSWALAPSNVSAGKMLEDAKLRLALARGSIQTARVDQAISANKGRKSDPGLGKDLTGQFFYVQTKNWSTVAGRSRKWTPPYVGPFECLSFDPTTSTLHLDLPRRYTSRRISPVFHTSQVKMYEASDASLFPHRLANPVPIFPIDCFLPRSSGIPSQNMNTPMPSNTPMPDATPLVPLQMEGVDHIKGHYWDKQGRLWFILMFLHGYAHLAQNASQLDGMVRQPYSDLMDRYLIKRGVAEEDFLPKQAPFKPKISSAQRVANEGADLQRELANARLRADIADQRSSAAKNEFNSQRWFEDKTVSIRRFGSGQPQNKRSGSNDHYGSDDYEEEVTESHSRNKRFATGATPLLGEMHII
ncbi:hypothetical protein P7C70_g6412, partial [Phenoliferia sp. Uapishka_3]